MTTEKIKFDYYYHGDENDKITVLKETIIHEEQDLTPEQVKLFEEQWTKIKNRPDAQKFLETLFDGDEK